MTRFFKCFIPLMLLLLLGTFSQSEMMAAGLASETVCDNVSEISQSECEALQALYDSTNGPNWSDNSGWLTTNTPCSWFGVTCASGSVTELNLSNNLIGTPCAASYSAVPMETNGK